MPESRNNTVKSPRAARERPISGLMRALLAFLFSTILLIPRVRRLRRRVLAWTVVRAFAIVTGAWLVWRFVHGTEGILSLLFAIGLALFGLLVKARPERKSLDDVARELNALVVLNGGSWNDGEHSKAIHEASIFVLADRLLVLTARFHQLAEIPLASVCKVSAHPAVPGRPRRNREAEAWQMEVTRNSAGETHTDTFRFEGFFAEHLARVAEQTIASVWKKQLPVLK